MNRTVYKEKRTFSKYDANHIIGYLNEEELDNYIPQNDAQSEEDKQPESWEKAYAYTGEETDGGTVMECEDSTKEGVLANAIIRSKYRVEDEMAIQRHAINGDYSEASGEYDEYNSWCEYAVATAKEWLSATK